MTVVTDVILQDLGPNKLDVLRTVDSLLHCGFSTIVRSLKEKPLHIASGESLEVTPLVQLLRGLGATVAWEPHACFRPDQEPTDEASLTTGNHPE
jgi:hypothetical protein